MEIEFTVEVANDLFLNLNISRLHVLVKNTEADGKHIDAITAASINLTLHSMFREIGLELNGRNVGNTSQFYPYRSHLKTLLNLCKEIQQTRLLCERWTKDRTGHMGVIAVGWNYAGLNARAATFARSTVVKIIGLPHLNVFIKKRFISQRIDLHIKLMPTLNNFVCKSAAPGQCN